MLMSAPVARIITEFCAGKRAAEPTETNRNTKSESRILDTQRSSTEHQGLRRESRDQKRCINIHAPFDHDTDSDLSCFTLQEMVRPLEKETTLFYGCDSLLNTCDARRQLRRHRAIYRHFTSLRPPSRHLVCIQSTPLSMLSKPFIHSADLSQKQSYRRQIPKMRSIHGKV